jgi:hypothetical protein
MHTQIQVTKSTLFLCKEEMSKIDNSDDVVIDLQYKCVFSKRQQFSFFARLTNTGEDD